MEDKKYVNITKVYTKRGDKGETDLLGGSVARTVVRRAERRIVSLTAQEPDLNPLIQKYVNRLSDLMFVLARYSEEVENKKWKSSNLNI